MATASGDNKRAAEITLSRLLHSPSSGFPFLAVPPAFLLPSSDLLVSQSALSISLSFSSHSSCTQNQHRHSQIKQPAIMNKFLSISNTTSISPGWRILSTMAMMVHLLAFQIKLTLINLNLRIILIRSREALKKLPPHDWYFLTAQVWKFEVPKWVMRYWWQFVEDKSKNLSVSLVICACIWNSLCICGFLGRKSLDCKVTFKILHGSPDSLVEAKLASEINFRIQ